jgi:hypothetical protein
MKKILFALLTIAISFEGYSQTMNSYFDDLESKFSDLGMEFDMLSFQFDDLEDNFFDVGMYFDMTSDKFNDLESLSMNMSTHYSSDVSSWWAEIASRFDMIENHLGNDVRNKIHDAAIRFDMVRNDLRNDIRDGFSDIAIVMDQIGNTFGGFDGSFNSLTQKPTTLAGYGITDGGDFTFSYNGNQSGGIEVANYTTASGSRAFAVGNDNLASGSSSTAMGRGTIASGDDSTALGANTEASGIASSAMGERTTASGDYSTAMGYSTTASGDFSTASGEGTTASGMISTAMGAGTTANGMFSTAMGYFITASDRSSLIIGQHNLLGSTVTNSATDFSLENTAFVIGNGTNSANRSDALVVKFNGDATLAGNLNINSDARLKANIVSLGSTLSKLLQIDGKSYTMKKDESEKQKIGLLAQDIEKVFPELVSESHGVKSVNYQGLVPVLINALKEQEEKIKSQENKLLELESLVQDLIDNQ